MKLWIKLQSQVIISVKIKLVDKKEKKKKEEKGTEEKGKDNVWDNMCCKVDTFSALSRSLTKILSFSV